MLAEITLALGTLKAMIELAKALGLADAIKWEEELGKIGDLVERDIPKVLALVQEVSEALYITSGRKRIEYLAAISSNPYLKKEA